MPKGQKFGGRTKGTPNKSTSSLMAICEQYGIDPFEAMLKIAVEERNPDKKFDKLKEIAQYLYPKRKAIEHSGDAENGFKIIVEDYRSKK